MPALATFGSIADLTRCQCRKLLVVAHDPLIRLLVDRVAGNGDGQPIVEAQEISS